MSGVWTGPPTALAHKLPRVAGSTPGPEPSQEALTGQARTGPYEHTVTVAYINRQGGLRFRQHSAGRGAPASMRFKPSEHSRTDTVQDQGGRGAGLARGAVLAHSDLVPRTDAPRDSPSLASHREDPRKCPIRVVLSFLQQGLERRLSPFTLKVYVAAIAANHDPVEGKSVGKHDLVIRFLRGAGRLNPPRPPLYPLGTCL